MKKMLLLLSATALLFVACKKEDAEEPEFTLDNTTWKINSTFLVGAPTSINLTLKDNDSLYVGSTGIGTWAFDGDSVQMNIATLVYKGGFPTDTTMNGRITVSTLPAGTFTGLLQ